MSDLVNQLTSHTGLSPELVQKGLGALLSFLKKELGEETFSKLETSIPEASALRSRLRVSTGSRGGGPSPRRSLFDMVSGLAGKLLGRQGRRRRRSAVDFLEAGLQARTDRGVSAQGTRADQDPSLPRTHPKTTGGPAGNGQVPDRRSQAGSLRTTANNEQGTEPAFPASSMLSARSDKSVRSATTKRRPATN